MKKGYSILILLCCVAPWARGQAVLTRGDADLLYAVQDESEWQKFTVPPQWTYFSLPFPIFVNRHGRYMADVQSDALRPAGYQNYPQYFVDPIQGADSNPGTSRTRPFRSMSRALEIDGNKWVLCRPGLYPFTQSWRGATPEGNTVVEPWDDSGRIVSSGRMTHNAWTPGVSHTYTHIGATFTNQVIDHKSRDQWGNGVRYRRMQTVAEVMATPGSFCVNGKSTTLRTFDGRVPDADILLLTGQQNGRFDDNAHLYVRGVDFEGGSRPFAALTDNNDAGQVIVFDDCTFQYAIEHQDGLTSDGPGTTYLFQSHATGNAADGFDYKNGRRFVEVNCIGSGNGHDTVPEGEPLDNGSTAHVNCVGLTINGLYADNRGRNIHDVIDSRRMILGSQVGFSRGTILASADIAAGTGDSDRTFTFLIHLRYLGGSSYARQCALSSRMYSRGHLSAQADFQYGETIFPL
ncbi:MAG: hypothetical protein SFX74_05520 [Fimbriimonadaceae bacterium]|nr:hypothetical protein [Fimbriimonadaceae bacterium]